MGKNILIALFLISFISAVFALILRDEKLLRENVDQTIGKPRITLEEFTMFNYSGHKVRSTISGDLANFVEPNVVEVYGNIVAMNHTTTNKESLRAGTALAYYDSNGITEIMSGAPLLKAELSDNVIIASQDRTITTRYAEFIPSTEIIQSDMPVNYSALGKKIKGEEGFTYRRKKDNLVIRGPIKGVLKDEK